MMTRFNWQTIQAIPQLLPTEIHIFSADLDLPSQLIENYFTLLSPDEQVRANRFHFPRDRAYYIAARVQLRAILSQYTQQDPAQLKFTYNTYGKPHLSDKPELQFNLSHSRDIALYAITLNHPVGVDIEYAGRECDIEGITQRFFSANEHQTLQTLTGHKKRIAFFNGWARKEAFLKAIGHGLSYSLANVEVTLLPEQPAAITALHDSEQAGKQWILHALDPAPGYVAALAIEGVVSTLKTWVWNIN